MWSRHPDVTTRDIEALEPGLRRYVAGRGLQPTDVDDLIQETLTRLLDVRKRLELPTLFAYAITVLNNHSGSLIRAADRERRHLPRLVDTDPLGVPADSVEEQMQWDAVREAMAALPAASREALASRYLDTTPAEGTPASPARLARARARLRVHTVAAYRRVDVPPRCQSMLVALSERNARRIRELGADRHLLLCPVCESLADPVLTRDRRLLGLAPLLLILKVLRRGITKHPAVSAASTATVAAAAVAAALVLPSSSPTSTPSALCRLTMPQATRMVGQRLAVPRAVVARVTGDETFLLATCHGRTVQVHLISKGESPQTVRSTDRVELAGVVVRGNTRTGVGLAVQDGQLHIASGGAASGGAASGGTSKKLRHGDGGKA